jgi:hypothetical protein
MLAGTRARRRSCSPSFNSADVIYHQGMLDLARNLGLESPEPS